MLVGGEVRSDNEWTFGRGGRCRMRVEVGRERTLV